jgi:hypothetical protein
MRERAMKHMHDSCIMCSGIVWQERQVLHKNDAKLSEFICHCGLFLSKTGVAPLTGSGTYRGSTDGQVSP